jgi:hypothetical protein
MIEGYPYGHPLIQPLERLKLKGVHRDSPQYKVVKFLRSDSNEKLHDFVHNRMLPNDWGDTPNHC